MLEVTLRGAADRLKDGSAAKAQLLLVSLVFFATDTAALIVSDVLVGGVSVSLLALYFTGWIGSRFYLSLYPGYGLLSHLELRLNTRSSLWATVFVLLAQAVVHPHLVSSINLLFLAVMATVWAQVLRSAVRKVLFRVGIYRRTTPVEMTRASGEEMLRFFARHSETGIQPLLLQGPPLPARGAKDAGIDGDPRAMELVGVHGSFRHERFFDPRHSAMVPMYAGGHSRNKLIVLRALKRSVDLVLACLGLVLLLPLFLVVALLIRLGSAGPVIYASSRLGKDGRVFPCYKFRTMYVDAEERLEELLSSDEDLRFEYELYHKLRSDPRVTRIGRLLRKLSLDELPQLINIVAGDMSVVGPRPYLPREQAKMQHTAQMIFKVTPGLTGYWQVKGRNASTFEERLEMDRVYVRHWSLWWDFMIFIDTIKVILHRKGAF